MRPISKKRQRAEDEPHEHAVRRGRRGRLHFENMPWLEKLFKFLLRTLNIRRVGGRNALDIKVERVEFEFDNLPAGFDGTRVLLVTDPHIDEFPTLAETILNLAGTREYDFCILGGDYNFGYRQESGMAYLRMKELAEGLVGRGRVFGVLGNHDKYRMGEMLAGCGVEMLVNDNVRIERNGDSMHLVGLDDCHYYGADDIDSAQRGICDGAFKLMISHSPEAYAQAARAGCSLYLAGHTHGGQVCLPGGIAVVTCVTVPRKMVKGKWRHGKMAGYTSRGVGASGVPVRFFCPPEMTVITLHKA